MPSNTMAENCAFHSTARTLYFNKRDINPARGNISGMAGGGAEFSLVNKTEINT